jgi:decaprenylphospho-beta-D-ribofuranose 2-oxidase
MIARGLGRSYGDSSLADKVLDTRRCATFVPSMQNVVNWCVRPVCASPTYSRCSCPAAGFLRSRRHTIRHHRRAVASDVHGKNHHLEGSFCDHVMVLKVATARDGIVTCSREHNADLFHATCGGMGLTGVIVEVTLRLKRIVGSRIDETTLRAGSLAHALELFEAHAGATYSVAWIDCLARGAALGRSLLMLGEHAESGAQGMRRAPGLKDSL